MKSVFPKVIGLAMSICLTSLLPAKADLYQIGSAQFGANSLTVDSRTGLTWLDLPFSTGLSYNQALADTAPGGIFSGYRLATEQEVLGLFASAGLQQGTYYFPNDPAATSFASLIGSSGTINGYPGMNAISGTLADGGMAVAVSFYASGVFGQPPNAYVYSLGDGTHYALNTSYPDLADWLVAVPEPGTWAIALAGFVMFVIVRRVKGASL